MDAVLQEIEQTEEGYVRDVEKLCSIFVTPLREEQALSKGEIDSPAIAALCSVRRGTVSRHVVSRDAHLSVSI